MNERVDIRTGDVVVTGGRKRTLRPAELPTRGLACRLAGHYSKSTTDNLAEFYWTGHIYPEGGRAIARAYRPDQYVEDSRGMRDPQAITAELRALVAYLDHHAGQKAQRNWLDKGPIFLQDYSELVVPWSWRQP